jgi:ABC-type proline/glycine betaine transport system ATPase subunit
MGEAFALGDRVGVLEGGRLIAYDRPDLVAASREPLVRKLLDALPVVPRGPAAEAAPRAEGGAGTASAR